MKAHICEESIESILYDLNNLKMVLENKFFVGTLRDHW